MKGVAIRNSPLSCTLSPFLSPFSFLHFQFYILHALATETFFEKPAQLRKEHPELYEELYGFYRVNPVEWD
jgi:hypothetical protein